MNMTDTGREEPTTEATTAVEAVPRQPVGGTRARNFFVSSIVGVVGLTVVVFLTRYNMQPYPVWATTGSGLGRSWEEYLLVNVTGLLLLPMLAVLVMPAETPAAYGWSRPVAASARIAAALYIAMLPVLFWAARLPAFQQYYPIQPQAAQSLAYLAYFELTYGMYMLTWEFFFRGFLTFGLARGFGPWAPVILQAVAFGIMHIGKPMPEIIGSFAAGIALGILALKGRSFLHCFVLHWACALTFDLMIIRAVPGGLF